jgi:homospermidine synthase
VVRAAIFRRFADPTGATAPEPLKFSRTIMPPSWKFKYNGRILIIGYGSVARCTMPLIDRHFDMPLSRVAVVDAEDHGADIAPWVAKGVTYVVEPVVPENMAAILSRYVGRGDLILNLSVEVGSMDVMNWCQEHGVLYLDTCLEPWANYYANPKIPADQRTNYYLRYLARENAKRLPKGAVSALITHGANPGLISHFVKQALLEVAAQKNIEVDKPTSREGWAALAQRLGTKVIHVAEHDTQIANVPKRPGEFVNTWSIPGFCSEGLQPSELGWGTHEKRLPKDGHRHRVGSKSAIFLDQPGCLTQVRSWTPIGGQLMGFLITHGEAITLSDYLTVGERGKAVYRPTVHYAYHPCNDAVLSVRELVMRNFDVQPKSRLLGEEIVEGIDELGALLMGDHGALWYGSQLSIEEARQLLGPQYNATSIQIAIPVIAGAMWLIEHPNQGMLEPEDLDHDYVLNICKPYLGPVVAVASDWTPLKGRGELFPEPGVDWSDPWQFQNFRIT